MKILNKKSKRSGALKIESSDKNFLVCIDERLVLFAKQQIESEYSKNKDKERKDVLETTA